MNLAKFLGNPYNYIFIGFCIVALVQIFYYLYFFSRLAFFKIKPPDKSQTQPVSVIICAKNEAENLANFLPGSLVQKYSTTHEVILVNDNSTDESKYILEEYQKTFKQLQVVELKQEAALIPGKKFPLSVGIKTAKYEVVLLTDADCVPASENWIEKMQECFAGGKEIVLGYSPFQKKKGILNKIIRWEGFHTAMQYLSFAKAGIPYMGVGRNLSYKKTIFFRHKGFSAFNNLPGGDDDLFINRAATKDNVAISIDPETFTITRPASTFNQWKRQKQRHYSTSRYYKTKHKFLLGLYAFTSFLFYPLLIASFLFFDWKFVLSAFFLKTIIQYFIVYKCEAKLREKDLAPFTFLFDLWMFAYYLIFAGSLIRRPRKVWK